MLNLAVVLEQREDKSSLQEDLGLSLSNEEDIRIIRDNLTIFFVVNAPIWSRFLINFSDKIADVALRCFEAAGIEMPSDKLNSLSLIFTNDEDIHGINKEWRDVDKPTNVLSFPTFDLDELEEKSYLNEPEVIFGDVILTWEYCRKEAETANIPFFEHIMHLVIHGILHILGYDHIELDEAKLMEALEISILAEFGFSNPY